MTQHIIKTVSVVIIALALSACASTFRSDVTSFHTLTPSAGAKVVLLPIDEKRVDSLEYRQYASSIQGVLENNGFVGARENKPEYIIGFDVRVSDGREKIRAFPGGFGAGNPYWANGFGWGGWWNPAFQYNGGVGGFGAFGRGFGGSNITARTVYLAMLRVEIREPDGTMIFEGTAETESRSRRLTELVPLLAAALFEEFPGENGKTRRIKLDLDKN